MATQAPVMGAGIWGGTPVGDRVKGQPYTPGEWEMGNRPGETGPLKTGPFIWGKDTPTAPGATASPLGQTDNAWGTPGYQAPTGGDPIPSPFSVNSPTAQGQDPSQFRPGSMAWRQAGGGVAQQQQQNQQPGGQSDFQIQTGITPGPVLPQDVIQQQQNQLQSYQPAFPQYPTRPMGAGASALSGQLRDIVSQATSQYSTEFGREAAFANAQQLLESQRAQAGAGTDWGRALVGNYASQLGNEGQAQNALLSMIQSMMAGGNNG